MKCCSKTFISLIEEECNRESIYYLYLFNKIVGYCEHHKIWLDYYFYKKLTFYTSEEDAIVAKIIEQ